MLVTPPGGFEFPLTLDNCSSRHPSHVTSTFLRLPWEEAKQDESFLPVDFPEKGQGYQAGRESIQSRHVLGEKGAGLHAAWLLLRKQSRRSWFWKQNSLLWWRDRPPVWLVQSRVRVVSMSAGSGDSSGPQPSMDPIDTHRMLFHYLREKQSFVLKFKAMVPVCSLTWYRWAFIGNTFCSASSVLMKTNNGALCPSRKRGLWNLHELPVQATASIRSFCWGEDLHAPPSLRHGPWGRVPWVVRSHRPPAIGMLMWGEGSGPLSTGQSAATTGRSPVFAQETLFTVKALNYSLLLFHITTAIQMWGFSIKPWRQCRKLKSGAWLPAPESYSHVTLCKSLSCSAS